ncbi:MAG: RidA family protein [Planctomycetota bacterium]
MIETKLADLGLSLPEAPRPVAAYRPAVVSDGQVVVSGQLPMREGRLTAEGPVPSPCSLDCARQAARQCVLNALAAVKQALDADLGRLQAVVRLGVFVASEPGFAEQHKVADGASELLVELMGDAGRHARAAVGVLALPLGASVEVELTGRVRR